MAFLGKVMDYSYEVTLCPMKNDRQSMLRSPSCAANGGCPYVGKPAQNAYTHSGSIDHWLRMPASRTTLVIVAKSSRRNAANSSTEARAVASTPCRAKRFLNSVSLAALAIYQLLHRIVARIPYQNWPDDK